MRHVSGISTSIAAAAIPVLLGVSPLRSQQVGALPAKPATDQLVAVAALRDITDYARHSLHLTGRLLLDSVAFSGALPFHAAQTAAQATEPEAGVVAPKSVIMCTQNTLRCSISNEGILISLHHLVSTADSATADVTLKWTVHSPPPRGDELIFETYRLQLMRGPRGWSVVKRVMIDEN